MRVSAQLPLIVITGPTGSGKTGLALKLASRYKGEIVCADSRTVYRGMDIGTAKPTLEEQARVPHHLIDVTDHDERFTAAQFKHLAVDAIASIRTRNHVPMLVGGTGLYVDGVVLDYQFGTKADDTYRRQLEDKSTEELLLMLENQHIATPRNPKNRRHLVRALEQKKVNTSRRRQPQDNTIVVAITTDINQLAKRLRMRAEMMFRDGVVNEAQSLAARYGWESEAMTGNVYPILRRVIQGEIAESEAVALIAARDRQLAKRQITWLKRHGYVRWLSLSDAEQYLAKIMEWCH